MIKGQMFNAFYIKRITINQRLMSNVQIDVFYFGLPKLLINFLSSIKNHSYQT